MSTLESLAIKYLRNFKSYSPFNYEIADKTGIMLRRNLALGQPPEMIVVVNLREMFLRHVGFLESNLSFCDEFGTTTSDLESFRTGLLTPLVMIQVSSQGLSSIVYYYVNNCGFSQDLASWILSKKDISDASLKQKTWMEIFLLASDYVDEDYYRVGTLVSQRCFLKIIKELH